MEFLPRRDVQACITRYGGDRRLRSIHISRGKMHDVTVLDLLPIEAGAF
jgi:hypothetical protein